MVRRVSSTSTTINIPQSLLDSLLADLGDGADADGAKSVQSGAGESMDIEVKASSLQEMRPANLRHSMELQRLLQQIDECMSHTRDFTHTGPIEEDSEYPIIVKSNEATVKLADELADIVKSIRDIYSRKFPDLESTVLNPLEYVKVVKRIGNRTEIAPGELSDILSPATMLVVSLSASRSTAKLPEVDLQRVMEACDEALMVEEKRRKIEAYIESRMMLIAPNLSMVVGPGIAAKLISVAGGLLSLSRMPSCNLQLLGINKKLLSGFSSTTTYQHAGFIYDCDLVKRTPAALRTKACRLVAGKCTLCARVDAFHESPDGSVGRKFREEIETRLEKLQEPPPPKQKKPLPAPDDKPKKHRGGRKMRKWREKYGMTELRKQQNRIMFGVAESEYRESGVGFGTIGKEGSGKLRVTAVDKGLLKAKRGAKAGSTTSATPGGATTIISGLATSVAFTPSEGIAFQSVDAPSAKLKSAPSKYFDNSAGFAKAQPHPTPSQASQS